jgi:hypothetical protein
VKTILVPVDYRGVSESVLATSQLASRCLDAQITGIGVIPDPDYHLDPGLYTSIFTYAVQESVAAVKSDFCAFFADGTEGAASDTAKWAEQRCSEAQLALLVRCYDLVVLGNPRKSRYREQSLFRKLLYTSGRPVLMAGSGGSDRFGRHIAVFWDGSQSTARTFAMVRPLLQRADCVTVLLPEQLLSYPGRDDCLLRNLLANDVRAKITLISADRCLSHTILSEIANNTADVLVAGASGGFFSRRLLKSLLELSEVPLLLGH